MLLDTCALLWLSHQQENLSSTVLKKIDAAPVVYISSITGLEIGLKYKSGKLALPVPPRMWFEAILEHHNIFVIEIDLEIYYDSLKSCFFSKIFGIKQPSTGPKKHFDIQELLWLFPGPSW